MIENIVNCYGDNIVEAYHNSLVQLHDKGEISDCLDWNTTQKECNMTIVVNNPMKEPMISKCFIGGVRELQQYIMEILDGILDFEIEKGNWAYTYHDRMVNYDGNDQIDFVVNELKRNPSSRRAVIIVRNSSDIGSNDPSCLQHIQFFIRNGKLDCNVLFRSNDACKATFMNMFALVMLQKRIADTLEVEVGTYIHRANSFHCYEKDFGMLEGYVNRIINSDLENLSYSYIDDWKELMDDCIDDIMKTVKQLNKKVR